jgi:acyl-CoA synthetase (AMP-forming)/AMP-acid ligase II
MGQERESAVVDGRWAIPGRFYFARDVVERLAADRDRRGLTFVDRQGAVAAAPSPTSPLRPPGGRACCASSASGGRPRARARRQDARLAPAHARRPEDGRRRHPLLGHAARPRPLAFRARHSGARLLVADRGAEAEVKLMQDLLDERPLVLYVDEARARLAEEPDTAATEDTAAGDPAFILYTSGTTKDPKGVTHTHGWCFAKRMQADAASPPGGRPRLVHRRDRLGEVDLERAARPWSVRRTDRPPRAASTPSSASS